MSDLEEALAAALARRELAATALRGKHVGGEWADYRAADDSVLEAERALAAARGEEHALACSGFPKWSVGAPLPHVLHVTGRTTLAYLVDEPDPTWDGRTARVVDATREGTLALVRFARGVAVRVGAPNDEVISGHPLQGKGLAPYRAHVVVHSRWIEELQRINAVHRQYDQKHSARYTHYLLAFHDEMFECIAESFSAETKRASLASVIIGEAATV